MEESMNLLKLCGTEASKECKVDIDYYVPVSAYFEDSYNLINEGIVYWRTGDIERSLIEIGIGSNTGVLKKITLTVIKNVILSGVVVNCNKVEVGVPVFDVSIIPQKGIYDYINDFQVYLGEDTITAIIGKIDKCGKMIRIGRVDIGVDYDDYLTHVSINGLSADEYKELKESFKL